MTVDFVKESRVQIARLKNDLRYRYLLEKEAKELAELKAAEKAKNKKKWFYICFFKYFAKIH